MKELRKEKTTDLIDRVNELVKTPGKDFDAQFIATDAELQRREPFVALVERIGGLERELEKEIKELRSLISQLREHRHLPDGTPAIKI